MAQANPVSNELLNVAEHLQDDFDHWLVMLCKPDAVPSDSYLFSLKVGEKKIAHQIFAIEGMISACCGD